MFTRLKTFVSRYTLEMGERITGIPADQIQQIAETMAKNRPGSILYALGMTQHTTGVQGIRSFTILQLLLGNIGKPGGGVNALRGEPNVQGACDMAVLYNYYPGYLNSPTNAEPTIYHYVRKNGIADSRYLVNTLKAFFGDAATVENDYGYEWLPKRDAVQGLRHHADVRGRPRRQAEDALDRRPESRGHAAQPHADVRGDGEARDAGGPGDLGDGDRGVLEASRRRPEVDQHRSDPAARGVLHGEERHHQQLGRHGAVAPRRREAAGAGQARRRDRGPWSSARCAIWSRTRRSRGTRSSSKAFWTYTTAEDVLREINGYALRDNPETGLKKGDLDPQGQRSAGRRFHVVRRLDLRRRLRRRREPLEAPRLDNGSGRPRPLSGLRVDLAEQHAHPLQPRVVRQARQALSGLEAHRLVGREGEALDGIRRAGRPRR